MTPVARARILIGPRPDAQVRDLMEAAGTVDLLATAGEVVWSEHAVGPGFAAELAEADAVVLLDRVPDVADLSRTAVVSVAATGYEYYLDVEAMHRQDLDVAYVPSYGDHAIAEHALALVLALAKNLRSSDLAVRAGRWPQVPSVQLVGKTAGVVGLGGIGLRMVQKLEALGMEVLVWSRTAEPARLDGTQARFVSLEELFDRSRVVSLHLAMTPETTGIIDSALLGRAAPGTILVNTARAALIAPGALEAAVESGRVLAALDVLPTEPPTAAELAAVPGSVLLSPHAAFNTPEAAAAVIHGAAENVVAFLKGAPTHLVRRS